MKIIVRTEDFNVGQELDELKANPKAGAVVMFVGTVRDVNEGQQIDSMSLEHYPGMTEKSLQMIVEQAFKRWDLVDATVIHRVGELKVSDQIVLIAVSSAHRGEAFDACEFIIDYLKTEAPFWKKEKINGEGKWVETRENDDKARKEWQK